MSIVVYDSNNSGGSWWLSDEDWDKLADAGWNVHWISKETRFGGIETEGRPIATYENPLAKISDEGHRWLGARACSAAKEFEDPTDAITEFAAVTGQDPSAEGCNCCGPPHSFQYEDDEGRSHYATARVVATDISFDS